MKTDIQIANEAKLERVSVLAERMGIPADDVYHYGPFMAKIPMKLIDEEKCDKHNLILVTAITPTKAGIGKTTVSVGLTQALNYIGKNAIAALREPSLGPCFGLKGGAAGGGYSQVVPMENINLHFTGDFHAVTSAHNMIAALLDNHIFQNRNKGIGLKQVIWKRVLDINDRNLRSVVTGLGSRFDGVPGQSGFDITPASEMMAILCLSTSIDDLRRRIGKILLGYTYEDKPFTVDDLGVTGAITVLLKDALQPNLVQTLEHNPVFVHGGPFANIAHGCNSILATKMALTYGDYVITEAGFGADLGAEKFFDIKCRKAGLQPKLTIIVATAQSLKLHGEVPEADIKKENIDGLRRGFANLDKHVANMKKYGQTVIVTFNRYATDTETEIEVVRQHCKEIGVGFALNSVFAEGGKGGVELAQLVVDTIEKSPSKPLQLMYADSDSIKTKIEKVAKNIYGAASVNYSAAANKMIQQIEELGISHYPVCIAKTQYSFSADPLALNATDGFDITVREVVINNGAEMIVAITGDIMRMPGLPKSPQALRIDYQNGEVVGLS